MTNTASQNPNQMSHFRKRRRQAVVLLLAITGIILTVAIFRFYSELDQAQASQQWQIWRDEHCVQAGPMPAGVATANVYGASEDAQHPGIWDCDDGHTYKLADSSIPPRQWLAAAPEGAEQ